MSLGGKKPSKPKVSSAKSPFNEVKSSTVSNPFGTSTSRFAGKVNNNDYRMETDFQLAPDLAPIPGLAGQGIQSNLRFLQLSPDQQFAGATSGQNPLYNLLAEQTKRNTDAALGRALVDAQSTGLTNSTTAGAARAGILNDALIRANNDILSAINWTNDTSRQNLGANLNALGSIANIALPMTSLTNSNLMQVGAGINAAALADAQARNQANIVNAGLENQFQEQQRLRSPMRAFSFINPIAGALTGNFDASAQGLGLAAQFAGAGLGFGSQSPYRIGLSGIE